MNIFLLIAILGLGCASYFFFFLMWTDIREIHKRIGKLMERVDQQDNRLQELTKSIDDVSSKDESQQMLKS